MAKIINKIQKIHHEKYLVNKLCALNIGCYGLPMDTLDSKIEENAYHRYSQKSKNDHNSSLQHQIEIKLCEHDIYCNKMITRPQKIPK